MRTKQYKINPAGTNVSEIDASNVWDIYVGSQTCREFMEIDSEKTFGEFTENEITDAVTKYIDELSKNMHEKEDLEKFKSERSEIIEALTDLIVSDQEIYLEDKRE